MQRRIGLAVDRQYRCRLLEDLLQSEYKARVAVGYYSRTSAVAAAAGIGRDGRRERKQLNPGGKGYSAFHSVGLDDNTIAAAVAYADAVVAAGDGDADDGAYRLLPSSRTTLRLLLLLHMMLLLLLVVRMMVPVLARRGLLRLRMQRKRSNLTRTIRSHS